jgi:DNA-binding LytR/AlgR family response regulator
LFAPDRNKGKMKVLVVEDEPLAAKRLVKMLESMRPDMHVLQVIDSVEDAVAFFQTSEHVDLVFMDVQLADGLSFEIFQKATVNCPVIFTTAFDHFAVQAFKVNSVDYLLKPIEEQEMERALGRFEELFHAQKDDMAKLLSQLSERKAVFRKRFLVKSGGRLVFVNVPQIAYFFSEEGLSFLVTTDNERYLLENTLEELEHQLDPELFFRINRGMIVSLSCMARIEPHFNNRLLLELVPSFEHEVTVSRQRSAEFKQWLNQ